MPVKLGSKLPSEHTEARIEIVPLIDIMFFLLAAFMLVSLSMVNLKGVKVNLPTATTATPETKRDLANITVNREGVLFLDGKIIGRNELAAALSQLHTKSDAVRVFISGDRDCRHGDVLEVLDLVRAVGIQNVAFETRSGAQPAPAR